MIVENEIRARRPELSPAKQALLEKRLRGEAKGFAKQRAIPRRPPSCSAPLSFAQQRLWFFSQLEPESPLYNMPVILRLRGKLHTEALEKSLSAIMARHEALRTRVASMAEGPIQVIDPPAPVPLRFEDLASHAEGERGHELERLLAEESGRPFDLTRDAMLRGLLVRLGADEHVLVLNIHHIVSDAWSWGVLFGELANFYEAFRAGRTPELPELAIQYADFAVWQRQWLSGEILAKQLAYWKQQLAGAPSFLELPTDNPRPPVQTFRGQWQSATLTRTLSDALKALSRREGVTLFMTLLAGFKTLLWRYTQQDDLLVGSPIAGRTWIETEPLIGFFINTLPLRTSLAGNPTFREVLRRVRDVTLGAYANQDLPFEKLVEELRPERSPSHSPLVQVVFVLQNAFTQGLKLSDLAITPVESTTQTAKFDLTISIDDREGCLGASIEYNTDLFEAATIYRMMEHFQILLESIVANPNARLHELPMLPASERNRLLCEWNQTQTPYPKTQTISQLFEKQAAKTPNAVAVRFGDEQLTYRELNARANQLAHHLRKKGVHADGLVGLLMERSMEMIVAILGIIKSGGAYISLDPNSPKERLAFIIRDAGISVLLDQKKFENSLPSREEIFAPCFGDSSSKSLKRELTLISLDTDRQTVAHEESGNLVPSTTPEHLAYVSYTSGTTGGPKGVCVPHRGVVRLVKETNLARFDASEVFLQFAPIAFDASTLEIWGPLLNGGQLVVFPPHTPTLAELGEFIREQKITTLWLTAGLFQQMVEEQLENLKGVRQLLAGGDVLSPPHMAKALRKLGQTQFINGYGPTENTTFTCCHRITGPLSSSHSIPIGAPISNTQVYILDTQLQPSPMGISGELCIGGDGLARNYLNQPELTALKLVPHPFSSAPGARLYRTGDRARWISSGVIEFQGRIDRQVKVRGFRVELEEIESILREHSAVHECLISTSEDSTGNRRLLAYVIPKSNPGPAPDELRRFLQGRLPDYMIPSAFGFLEALPITSNGKIDRRALPPLDAVRSDSDRKFVEPRDEIERQLAKIWEVVLGVHPIGVTDKFFELGGHSLLAVRMISQIEKTFGKRLRVAVVFQNSTVELLANVLREQSLETSISAVVEIQPKGAKPPLFFVHGVGGGMFWGYTNLSRYMGNDQPVYGFKSRGQDGLEEFGTIEEIAGHYVKELRVFQPQGPYYLAGYCFGGNVAYEMARQLHAQGQTVALLALMDCSAPNSTYDTARRTPRYWLSFLVNLFYCVGNFLQLNPTRRMEYVRSKSRSFGKRFLRRISLAKADPSKVDMDALVDLSSYRDEERALWEAHIRALLLYHPKPHAGRVILFRTRGHPLFSSFDSQNGWGEFVANGMEVKVVPGVHESMLEEPHVQVLAHELKACLEAVQQTHRS